MAFDDLERLRAEYADREQRLVGSDIYSYFNIANLYILQQRQRAVLGILQHFGCTDLHQKTILELGCGQGGVLLEFLNYGVHPDRLHGVDLLPKRVRDAYQRLSLPLACADGQHLPYATATFDLALQYTVFSSVLDADIKHHLASELLRVLKPSGLILWYDFWLNPTNPQTRGIRPAEIRDLFPNCRYIFRRITLAPPLARAIVPFSWNLALLLETLTLFNSHYLVAIQPLSL